MNLAPRGTTRATYGAATTRVSDIRDVENFGSNPGNLRMFVYSPAKRAKRCPAVVVLHGCTQSASGFDIASGWSKLADAGGFVLIYPEQKRSNNDQTCFSWYQPNDVARGEGEVESIRQMVDCAVDDLSVDPTSVFISGLSAGGAMTAAMLATYPELFAGGAIVAGRPYGAASNVSEALDAMFVGKTKDAPKWGDRVRSASNHAASWPKVAVWHGTNDNVVKPINAGELVKQWTNVHGVGAEQPEIDQVGLATRRIWRDADGCECVTDYSLAGLGHGVPVDAVDPPAPFFLPAGMSAVRQIAEDFGLLDKHRPDRRLSLVSLLA